VIRANNLAEFAAALARIRRIVDDPGAAVQVEEYIPGREFALEGLMSQGQLKTLAIFDKPAPLEGPFFEETIYVTPSLEPAETQAAIVETTRVAARALGLWHGPIHAEMRVNSRGVYMLEIAARPIGGLCSRALRAGTYTLEELVILHAVGEMPQGFEETAAQASGVMMIPVPRAGVFQGVTGIDEAREVPGIDDIVITAKTGEKLVPLPEGASYTGFIFASGPDPGFITSALRRAHAMLRFEVLSALDVLAT
jgi:biotin carboxylase